MTTLANVNGATISYEIVGDECAPALVLLHGAYLSRQAWEPQRDALASRCRLVIPDLRGHGESHGATQSYSVVLLADDIAALLANLGIKQAFVCGHSFGGMVAQQLALAHSHLVAGLVLAETSYGTRSTQLESLLTTAVLPLLLWLPVQWQARLFAQHIGNTPTAETYVRREIARHASDTATYRAIWRAVTAFDSQSRLPAITCPTLVLVGQHNRQTHQQGRTMAQRIPGAGFGVIPDAGHLLNWDNPHAFTQAVLRRVATQGAGMER